MTNNLQKKLFQQGYLKVKNVLNFQRDLKPILNDMEFVMDCLIQKFAKKKDVKKVLNLDFKKKYSCVSKLKIDDLELIYNTTKIPDESTNSINVTYLNDHLQFSNVVKEINYAIYNLQGQLMNIGKIDRYNRNVSITLESGIYFIFIQSKDHYQSIKILVD